MLSVNTISVGACSLITCCSPHQGGGHSSGLPHAVRQADGPLCRRGAGDGGVPQQGLHPVRQRVRACGRPDLAERDAEIQGNE